MDTARDGEANGRCGAAGGTKNRRGDAAVAAAGSEAGTEAGGNGFRAREGDPAKICVDLVDMTETTRVCRIPHQKVKMADYKGSVRAGKIGHVLCTGVYYLGCPGLRGGAADSDAANVSSPRSKEVEVGVNDDGAEEVDTPRKRKSPELDVARSIELLASSFVKIERARLEVYRDTERMRAEAEVKKGEMELRRTEIMAKTQLQIARLFAKRLKECVGASSGHACQERRKWFRVTGQSKQLSFSSLGIAQVLNTRPIDTTLEAGSAPSLEAGATDETNFVLSAK
ncbi:hypothetical protein TRIUR3_33466 [Triticum urartu]|uniref:Uncharacterized protein n=1 Tax=Triticum urartu TaxID=4572 RepID=M7ZKB0_TRIUA|nr:hypothetical protein TRIUR3_33466 [Triticum urartu]